MTLLFQLSWRVLVALTCLIATCGVSIAATNELAPGQSLAGEISVASQTNYYSFTAASNDVVYLTLLRTNGTGAWPSFHLHDPDGLVVATGSLIPTLACVPNLRLTKSGTYLAEVLGNQWDEPFGYLLTLNLAAGGVNRREPGDGPESLRPGQTGHGHIHPSDFDTFTFPANANDVVYLTVVRTNGPGVGPAVYLYDPDGTAIALASENNVLAYVPNLRLTKSGTYTVGVIDGGLDEAFDYVVTVNLIGGGLNEREPEDGPEALVPGQTGYGHIHPSDFDTFTFPANANDVVYLTVVRTNGPGVGPAVYLYDPDGTAIALASENNVLAYVPNLRLTKSGTYTVGVIDGGLDEAFDYTVCVVRAPGPNVPDPGEEPETLSPGETRAAHITEGDLDAFAFPAIAGDSVVLSVRRTDGPGTGVYAQLYAPDGALLSTATGLLDATVRAPCLQQTGTYTVLVSDDGLAEAFAYTLSLSQWPLAPHSSGLQQYLAILNCGGQVTVRWETNSSGFVLEGIAGVEGATGAEWMASTNWAPVPGTPRVVADHFYLDVNGSAAQFYRLRYTAGSAPP